MKASHMLRFAFITAFLLAACAGGGDLADNGDPMEFTEEEIEQVDQEASAKEKQAADGAETQGDTANGFSFDEDEVDPVAPEEDSEEEMDFSEEEVDRDQNLQDVMENSPSGASWLVTHEEGMTICPNDVVLTVPAGDQETITFQWLNDGNALETQGFGGTGSMIFTLEEQGVGGAIYSTNQVFGGVEMEITAVFYKDANFFDGTISGDTGECRTTRSYVAVRQ